MCVCSCPDLGGTCAETLVQTLWMAEWASVLEYVLFLFGYRPVDALAIRGRGLVCVQTKMAKGLAD